MSRGDDRLPLPPPKSNWELQTMVGDLAFWTIELTKVVRTLAAPEHAEMLASIEAGLCGVSHKACTLAEAGTPEAAALVEACRNRTRQETLRVVPKEPTDG